MSTEGNQWSYDRVRGLLSQITGGSPLGAAALTGGGGAALGALLGPTIASWLTGMPRDAGPLQFLASPAGGIPDELKGRIRRRFAVLGGVLGLSPWVIPAIERMRKDSSIQLEKGASLEEYIAYAPSIQVLENDPFLTDPQKREVLSIFRGAAEHSNIRSQPSGKLHGLLTTEDLIAGAVGAGLGYGGGATAGLVLSNIFGLPTKTVRRLSRIGTLAGALLGSGIIGG